MNLRWLFGNFADPQYALSREEQRELSHLAHKKYMPSRTFFLWTALTLLVPVGVAYKVVLPVALDRLGMSGRNGPYIVGVAIIILLFWVWSAWVYRTIYQRPVRLAMREKGHDVCVGCGYRLQGLSADTECPECGETRP
ncbi:MAG: hypothetical protein ACYTGC_00850 [Planctomycetota bacterium]